MTAILFPEAMCLADPISGQTSWGANQEWYGDLWQRKAGCGPTAAASLIFYQMQKQRMKQREALYSGRQSLLDQMNELWNYCLLYTSSDVSMTAAGWGFAEILFSGE